MINSTNSKVIITTHSPYILTSTNILLYSQKVENQHTKLNKIVIPKNLRVSYENFAAYKVDRLIFRYYSPIHFIQNHMVFLRINLKARPEYVNLERMIRKDYKGNVKIVEKQFNEKDIEL